ncbi:MAG: hypothetical protein ACLGG0_00635 [Bacteriovoracia bacterium]
MRFLCILFLIFASKSFANIIAATGVSAVTEGRVIPILYVGYDAPDFAATISSVGVANDVYYQSAYQLGIFRQTDLENFLWGKTRAGMGLGVHYAERGLEQYDKTEKVTDFSMGPSIRVTWEVLPYVVLGVESFVGIGSADIIILSTQQISTLFLGVRF